MNSLLSGGKRDKAMNQINQRFLREGLIKGEFYRFTSVLLQKDNEAQVDILFRVGNLEFIGFME